MHSWQLVFPAETWFNHPELQRPLFSLPCRPFSLPQPFTRVALGAINGAVWGSLVVILGFLVLFNFVRG